MRANALNMEDLNGGQPFEIFCLRGSDWGLMDRAFQETQFS